MNRAVSPLILGIALLLQACGAPEGCEGNCVEVCGGKMFEAGTCAAEYADGYSVGFCAGVLDRNRRGNEQGPFVAGYWDGYSDGSVLRVNRMIRGCEGTSSEHLN